MMDVALRKTFHLTETDGSIYSLINEDPGHQSNSISLPPSPSPPSATLQVCELSDLGDRPLVGALTSRLQALQAQLQTFVERVDGLAKPALGGRDPAEEEEGCGRPGSPPRPADSQSAANKVNARKHTIFFFFVLATLSLSLVLQSGLLLPSFFFCSCHKFCNIFSVLSCVQSTA